MSEQYQLKKPDSLKKRKRVGRGMSSGMGKTCCKGQNGQLSRSGAKKRPWFEGGQMPLQRRVPKRGFNNLFSNDYQVVNLSRINSIEKNEIDFNVLCELGVIKNKKTAVKVLGNGEISTAKTIYADSFSISAKEKIEKAGGSAIVKKIPGKGRKKEKSEG